MEQLKKSDDSEVKTPCITKLSERQRWHINRLGLDFWREMGPKYESGAREHGDNLLDESPLWLVEQALQEVIDQWVFLHRLREVLRENRSNP